MSDAQTASSKIKVPFMRFRRIWVGASLVAIVLSALVVGLLGLNFGIDFKGGSLIEIGTEGPADVSRIRGIVGDLGLGEVQVQEFGASDDILIRIEQQPGGETAQQDALTAVRAALDGNYGSAVTYRRTEVVGPKVGGELVRAGIVAVVVSVIAMLIYVWFRFDTQFGVGSVLALVHDVALTLGVFSILGFEFSLSIVAALLTIVGYSMNDTVVVYDRIRENLRKYKKMDLADLIDLSINETLSRTLVTSGTTLLALFALFFLGGEVIRGFTFAMIFGICVGTYSSIFVASPVLLWLGVRRDWSSVDRKAVAGVSR